MQKSKKARILALILFTYAIALSILIYPHYSQTEEWLEYLAISGGSLILAGLLSVIFYKRK